MASEEYLSASSFKVTIDGKNWEVFESVTGLGIDVEEIPFNEDKRLIYKRPGRYNARDVTLVRRFKDDTELYDWFKQIKDGNTERKSGSVILMDDEDNEVGRFNFYEAWPKSWGGPELSKDALGNDVLKEVVVLSVGDLEFA